jgi:hypothetical protein
MLEQALAGTKEVPALPSVPSQQPMTMMGVVTMMWAVMLEVEITGPAITVAKRGTY